MLAGGHQLKNAAAYEKKGAVITIDESKLNQNHELLLHALTKLLDNPTLRAKLSRNIATFARPDSAKELAQFIIQAAEGATA